MVLSFLWSPILICRSQVKKNDPFSPFSWSWNKLMVNRLTSGFIGYCNGHSSSTVLAGLALSSCFQLSLILLPPIYRCRILSLVRKQNPLLQAWEPLNSAVLHEKESPREWSGWKYLNSSGFHKLYVPGLHPNTRHAVWFRETNTVLLPHRHQIIPSIDFGYIIGQRNFLRSETQFEL